MAWVKINGRFFEQEQKGPLTLAVLKCYNFLKGNPVFVSYGSWSEVVCLKGNRVPFGTSD